MARRKTEASLKPAFAATPINNLKLSLMYCDNTLWLQLLQKSLKQQPLHQILSSDHNHFPFRKTTIFDSNRAMFVFCNPSFRHSKSCTDISWIVKIMDYRLDRNNEFVFPINTIGGMENIAIGMAAKNGARLILLLHRPNTDAHS